MLAAPAADKVRIKNDEQGRKKKRKRPETENIKKKKSKLEKLKDFQDEAKVKG